MYQLSDHGSISFANSEANQLFGMTKLIFITCKNQSKVSSLELQKY